MADGDWVVTLTDNLDRIIGTVRDKTTRPAITVVRAVVFGVVIAIIGITALVLLIVALVRLVNNFVPGPVWIAYLIMGSVLAIVGLILMWMRKPRGVTL
jgi:hypothetical protein